MTDPVIGYAIYGLIFFMFFTVLGIFYLKLKYERFDNTGKSKKKVGGIGRRTIQFLAVGLVIPTIIILALLDKLSGGVLGTLLGTFIGYVLSGIGDEKKEP